LALSYQKWVTNFVVFLKQELNLQYWRVNIEFDVEDADHTDGCVAFTHTDSRYLYVYVCFTPYAREIFEKGDMGLMVETVTHEMVHILLDPLAKFARQAVSPQTEPQLTDILEQTTQRIARIVAAKLPKTITKV
jgi:hypothetical protein